MTSTLLRSSSPSLRRLLPLAGLLLVSPLACRSGEASDENNDSEGSGSSGDASESEADADVERPDGWNDATHGNDVEPDFEAIFSGDRLLRFDITFENETWAAMQNDLASGLGSNAGTMGGPVDADDDYTPMWGEATVEFDGDTWLHVGARYKGNSTLRFAYQSGTDKFPFKLDFDEFEDTYPEVKNQRFYGFKQLNLGSNYGDDTMMREKVAVDLFREFGVPAAHAAFCEVYIDRGDGAEFVGIYSLVEEVDDTLAENQFAPGDGNLYKPDGDAASFAEGSFDEAEMDLKSNEETGDYSDVRALYDTLHSDLRTTNVSEFQTSLEAVFDVDHFLRYLAANQVIQNWDTYGVMTHNYFLYGDGEALKWIPWDNNEAFAEGKMGGALSLGLTEVGDDWPILRYVLDVPEYEETYRQYVGEFASEHFTPEKMNATYDAHAAVIEEAASRETSGFSAALETLKAYTSSRAEAVDTFLN